MVLDSNGGCAIDQLPLHERRVLRRIWEIFAGQSFDEGKLRMLTVERMSGMDIQLAFLSLREQGYIQAMKQGWGERLYFVPFAKRKALYRAFGGYIAPASPSANVELSQEGTCGISVDMFNVLVYVIKHEVAVTSKGVLHKRHIQRLAEIIALSQVDAEQLDLQYVHQDAYPAQVAVILDALFYFGLISVSRAKLSLNSASVEAWLELTREATDRLIFNMMMERFVPSLPAYQHFTWRLCDASLNRGHWYAAEFMLMGSRHDDGVGAVTAPTLLSNGDIMPWLCFMAGCGYMDIGRNAGGNLFVRWRVEPGRLLQSEPHEERCTEAGGTLYVQPDFELLLPPEVPMKIKFTTALFTERVTDDWMTVYRLTRDSIWQAAAIGIESECIVPFLQKQTSSGIPDNVMTALRFWSAENESLSIQDNREDSRLANLFEGNQSIYGGFTAASSGSINRVMINGIRGQHELQYELDETLPERNDVLPPLDHLPLMWVRDWRSYHSSTAKQMMEEALNISAKLEICVDGNRMEFVPHQLVRHPWAITGVIYEQDSDKEGVIVQLQDGEWKEMRLIIPS